MAKKARKRKKSTAKSTGEATNSPPGIPNIPLDPVTKIPVGLVRDEKGTIRKPAPVIDENELDHSPIDRLKGMRRVLRYGSEYDRTALHKMLRVWLKASPAAFMAAYERLEGEESKTVETSAAVGSAARDDGYERGRDEVTPKLERLIEGWLRETKERVDALP